MAVNAPHTHTPLSLFKGVLCFKFHHSCTNTHAQTVLPVLTNLRPVWRWLAGVFNYADCTSSMYNTSPRLWVLLTSCQSWRWVRLWIQRHVNYIKVNIQPLCCFSALTGLFPVSLSGWTLPQVHFFYVSIFLVPEQWFLGSYLPLRLIAAAN